jgi:ABC-type Mn2+/Zn2+ transport system ATPase subunit
MSKVINQIIEWIQTRPYWEQAAFKKLIDTGKPDESHFDNLIQWCLEDKKLHTMSVERETMNWEIISKGFSDSAPQSIQLKKLFNLQNVNALSENHSLTFHSNLTLIYGTNGSGKSGYSRVLSHLGLRWKDIEILPNIYSENQQIPNFSLEVSYNEQAQTINFEVGKEFQRFNGIYVFDSLSVVKQLTKSEKISFSPAGLKFLTELSDVVTKVNERFQLNFGKLSSPHSFDKLFTSKSQISQLIGGIDEKSIFERIEKLAHLTEIELEERDNFEKRLVSLKSQSVDDKITRINKIIGDLKSLVLKIKQIENHFNSEFISQIHLQIEDQLTLESKASQHGVEKFQSANISNVGSTEWHRFIDAAMAFANTQEQYPAEGSECLFCQQKLTTESSQLIQSLWIYLQEDLQERLKTIKSDISKKIKISESINLNFFKENEIGFIYLSEKSKDIVDKTQSFIKVLQFRKESIIESLQEKRLISVEELPISPVPEIENVIVNLENEISSLQSSNPKQEILELEAKLKEFDHRIILRENWQQIKEYRDNKEWFNKSIKAIGSTMHITKKYNELFKLLVTDKYIELFEKILRELKCPMVVDIATKPQKAQVSKQIVLKSSRENAKPDQILSEGEKRAVAIADFLTEATLDENSKVIVLDDPITSLDYDWKEIMAKRLISEAKNKQVIIFTHDLPFLFQLKNFCQEEGLDHFGHSINRGVNGIPGQTSLYFIPESVEDYKNTDKAKELLKKSEEAISIEDQIIFLKAGFNALRTTYEAFIVYKLFGGTVRRFDRHVKVGNLKTVCINDDILKRVEERFGFLSGFTGGHLASDYQSSTPSAEVLKKEIVEFEGLFSEWKKLKNNKSSSH